MRKVTRKLFILVLLILPGALFGEGPKKVAISPLLWEKGDSVGPVLSEAATETLKTAFGESGEWEVILLEKPVSGDRLTASARTGGYDYILFGRVSSSRGYQLQLSLFEYQGRTVIANRTSSVRRSVEIFGLCDRMALSLVADMTGTEDQDIRIDFAPLFGGGKGTVSDPFRIKTADHLINVDLAPFASFRLDNDIDLSGIPWVPLSPLYGSFDGNNHTLTGLFLTGDPFKSSGLFSGILPGGEVRNLVLRDVRINAANSAGALAGYNHGNVKGITVNGSVFGEYSTGGIIGHNEGEVASCSFIGEIFGHLHSIGGVVGRNLGSVILCRFRGSIGNDGIHSRSKEDYLAGSLDGTYYDAGGIAGWNNGTISRCMAAGSVQTNKQPCGGIAGHNNGTISDCVFSGTAITRIFDVGGIAGYILYGGSISNCLVYSSTITGGKGVGGLCGGINKGSLMNSCLVAVRFSGTDVDRFSMRRGEAIISGNYQYKTPDEINSGTTAPFALWDFKEIWEWKEGFPVLRNLPE